ncbi:probable ATP-dependent RNA helicase CG8611 [Anopheles maculipalpis]|uniref:probable ATP-dependent RNA helicase CG8611 n=1 Tax=Anopheles maculipalpis TaxID=1496333 RepID=UPI002158ACF7|nr:probable ATP-dependent RNA helicase CG8611 [Anopheles maculipalpis]
MDLMLSNLIFDCPEQVIKRHTEQPTKCHSKNEEIPMQFSQVQQTKAVVARKRGNIAKEIKSLAATVADKTPSRHIHQPTNQSSSVEVHKDVGVGENIEDIRYNKASIGTAVVKPIELLKKTPSKIVLPLIRPIEEKLFSNQSIESLEIHPHSKKNIADLLHFTLLTMVQNKAIPVLLKGCDALIRAQTGSGKTLAYALPLIESLHVIRPQISRSEGIKAVVIVPTRELAIQTYELMQKLLKPFNWIVAGYLTGGEKRKTEKARLRAGLNILIATPGRFCDHIRNTQSLKLANIQWLVLDEADRLLELGYEKNVKEIIDAIHDGQKDKHVNPHNKLQTVLLSATLTSSVKELAGLTLNDPVFIETSEVSLSETSSTNDKTRCEDQLLNVTEYVSMPGTVQQRYLIVPPKLRLVALSAIIVNEQRMKPSKLLVFMATQDLVDFHYDVMIEVLTLQKFGTNNTNNYGDIEKGLCIEADSKQDSDNNALLPGLKFYKLHGRMTQVERSSVFQAFRKATAAVLICTDVAARGIDIPFVDLVVQYHAPQILADYVHRVGRTARAGEPGKAVLFIEPSEIDFIKYLANKHIRIKEQPATGVIRNFGSMLDRNIKYISKLKELWAVELQHRYEQIINEENELFTGAKKAFVSWIKYYSNFPKELRNIFHLKSINMGHYAKSLGLRDAPKHFMQNYTEQKLEGKVFKREEQIRRNAKQLSFSKDKKAMLSARNKDNLKSLKHGHGISIKRTTAISSNKILDYTKRSRIFNTSEFESGIGPARKKVKSSLN